MSGTVLLIGPVEPTPRPSDPAWKWKGGGWQAEIGGLGCYLFNGFGSDPDYHAAVQLPSGAHLTGDSFKDPAAGRRPVPPPSNR